MVKKVKFDAKQFIAKGFGLGDLPIVPGTWGTVGGVILYLILVLFSWHIYLLSTIAMFILGCWLCEEVSHNTKTHDHPSVVWDEIVGYCISMIGVPFGIGYIIAGFILFRIFDILKPWPIGEIDQKMKNGVGMMLDDAVAGLVVCFLLNTYAYVW